MSVYVNAHISKILNSLLVNCAWYNSYLEGEWAIVPATTELSTINDRFDNALVSGESPSPSLPEVSVYRVGILSPVIERVVQMLKLQVLYQYQLVFFGPLTGYIYHRATNEAQTEFDTITAPKSGVLPLFEHHCHPYFAIWNALPKFKKYKSTLTKEQKEIHQKLDSIWKAWNDCCPI